MQLTQSRKLRQNAALKIPKILAQRDKAAKYKEEEENQEREEDFVKATFGQDPIFGSKP